MRSLRISAAALAVPLVLLATGCGESSSQDLFKPENSGAGGGILEPKGPSNEALSTEELSKKVDGSLNDLPNMRLEATGTAFDTPLSVDLKISGGQQAEGRVTLKDKTLDIVAVDNNVYVKIAPGTIELVMDIGKRAEAANQSARPDSATEKALGDQFTKMFVEAGKLVEGKYVKFGGSDASKLGGDMLKGGGTSSLNDLFGSDSDSDSDAEPKTPATKGPVTEINGVKVIPVITKDEESDETLTIYVAANGRPLPVRVTGDAGSDGSNEMTLDFKYSKLDQPVTPKAPPAGETIDLEAMMESFGGKLNESFGGGTTTA